MLRTMGTGRKGEMRVSRQIPWRKLKAVAMVCALLLLVHTLWTIITASSSVDGQSRGSHEYVYKQNGLLPQFFRKPVSSNVCKKIVPFKEATRGGISTFDLPDITDYSLNEKGRYKIPEEFYSSKDNPLTEPVEVILVPFSHADPGYGMTFENYYTSRIKFALNNMVEHLTQYRNMTFQWAETVFLERWFRDITPDTKQKVRDLIKRGQFEIVLGGWVMPDEASTHYQPVVDQLIEGHQWIVENLGVKPVNAWINDPFGYSSSMPYFWKKSGIENMVFLRIHQAIKTTLMRMRAMDFKWRPYWNSDNDVNDILCNLMPYPGYWNGDICGPDQSICKQFNFLHLSRSRDAVPVTDRNIDDLASKLYDAYKFTSSLYQYKTLVIFLGEDNSYDSMSSFKDTNSNYGKLIKYINAKSEWKMNIRFGTIRDYFANVRKVESIKRTEVGPQMQFPTLSGDFFPYSDFENDTWTGYYTTRIWMKRFTREIEPIIRAADVFSVLAEMHCLSSDDCKSDSFPFEKDILSELRLARRDVGMFQHHDGITGTSLSFVVDDYEVRLQQAFNKARRALVMSLMTILTRGSVRDVNVLKDNNVKENAKDLLSYSVFKIKDDMKIVTVNPLEKPRNDVVSFYTDRRDISIQDENRNRIDYQLSKPTSPKHRGMHLISLPVKLAPYEVMLMKIKIGNGRVMGNATHEYDYKQTNQEEAHTIAIKNSFMMAEFNAKTGFLERIVDMDGRSTSIKSDFLKYRPDKSGAYLFGPKGPAEPISGLQNAAPTVTVENGPVFSQVRVTYKSGFSQKFTLYHQNSIKANGLFVTNEISLNLEPTLQNTEVIWRFQTDINNNNLFFTDQNGFQLMGRKNYPKRPIETNYYPMTSMVLLEDENKRLAIHSAQSHGVASLSNGCLEIMMDRNVQRDDKKGLGTGVFERVLTLTEFIIDIQHKTKPEPIPEPRFTYPSVRNILLNELLQNKVHVFSIEQRSDEFKYSLKPKVPEFPCDLSVVGMRFLATNEFKVANVSLVLHRKMTHCSFKNPDNVCPFKNEPLALHTFMDMFDLDSNQHRGKVVETSLSHLHDKATLSSNSDLRPEPGELRSFILNTH